MKRGRKYSRGLEIAIPFALRRGHVMVFVAALLNLAEFLITGNGLFVLVRVQLARRIRADIADIESEFADSIAGLRLVPRTGPVSCELWLYSKHGILRCFRVENTRLVEIDCCGTPLDQLRQSACPVSMKEPATTPSGATPAGTANDAAAGVDPKSPVIRWLKKWNAARIAGNGAGADQSSELRTILESVRPGNPAQQKNRKKHGTNSVGKTARKKTEAAGPDNVKIFPGTGNVIPETVEKVADHAPKPVTETGPAQDGLSTDEGTGVPGETAGHPSPMGEIQGEEI